MEEEREDWAMNCQIKELRGQVFDLEELISAAKEGPTRLRMMKVQSRLIEELIGQGLVQMEHISAAKEDLSPLQAQTSRSIQTPGPVSPEGRRLDGLDRSHLLSTPVQLLSPCQTTCPWGAKNSSSAHSDPPLTPQGLPPSLNFLLSRTQVTVAKQENGKARKHLDVSLPFSSSLFSSSPFPPLPSAPLIHLQPASGNQLVKYPATSEEMREEHRPSPLLV